MDQVYFLCAAVGGGFLVLQLLLLVFGGDADADVEVEADLPAEPGDFALDSFVKVLSLKTLVAFSTFFGLAGLAGIKAEFSSGTTAAIAAAAGLLSMYMVAYLMHSLARLRSSGNVQLQNAVGSSAKVYLRIPARLAGAGKVTVLVQNRILQCKAVTEGGELATGTEVRVVALHGPDKLMVTGAAPSGE